MISVSHLTKEYAGRVAVDGISFEVAPGEIVGFLGPNGAGKSTTMRILSGYLPPTSGTATVGGKMCSVTRWKCGDKLATCQKMRPSISTWV